MIKGWLVVICLRCPLICDVALNMIEIVAYGLIPFKGGALLSPVFDKALSIRFEGYS
jgi:hypothetical protein